MSKLSQDCLIIIFEELEYDVKSLYSCLLINKLCYLKTLKNTSIVAIAQNTHDKNKFIRELFKMIFNYSPNIKKLIIFSDYVDQELCNIPELRKCFLNIIRYLNIKYCNYDNNPGLITLIKAQKNLKYFKCGFKASYEISCKGIGEALTKQADSILLIHLSCPIKFCCPIFTKFVNLKTLKINGKIVDKSLMKPNLPNLEYLELYGGYIYEAAIFIKSTKGSLREIRIKHDFHEKKWVNVYSVHYSILSKSKISCFVLSR
ncbi:uncharacterized protein OCT59_025274 [Rhizophagus irregularis]|uniref:uncharacterized protein n=1 Tax=Rhizophagus irregularis TaxID=588596 RepID=UPI00331B4B63|nr:hypothetical protein OCT59_025274 [Rhizophagus irregularis]